MSPDDVHDDGASYNDGRAWSTFTGDNSLFSKASSSATNATSASTRTQGNEASKLQVVSELAEGYNPGSAPQFDHPQQRPVSGTTPAPLPLPSSLPLSQGPPQRSGLSVPVPPRTPVPQAATLEATTPKSSKSSAASSLFGRPNIQIPTQQPRQPEQASQTTLDALAELHRTLDRIFSSVAGGGYSATLVSRATSVAQLIEDFALCRVGPSPDVTTDKCEELVQIIRIVLAFADNLVCAQNLRSTRMTLLRSLEALGHALGLLEMDMSNPVTMPRNFALGSHSVLYQDLAVAAVDGICDEGIPISEQPGAYVAPILRGMAPNFAIATICIGMPSLSDRHMGSVRNLQSICPELHVFARRDCIMPAVNNQSIVPPFRTPDPLRPPISVSIAPEQSSHNSGTLGGYIYPIVDESNTALQEFRNATFAITCGHVCLNSSDATRNVDKPVMVPSPVLVRLFKKALDAESTRYSTHSFEHQIYRQAIAELDLHPPRSIGTLMWGERAVLNSKFGANLSDLAIIKCDPSITCRNELGDDIDFAQEDLGLVFQRKVNYLIPRDQASGLTVFKYGATTKYTSGVVSSARIVYWSDNKLQSSEFAVRADSPLFASGGDSGSWILSRDTGSNANGLGVVGMVHSYDGEFKEFGLFTPIHSVLNRLNEVTGIPWGVVGVPSQEDNEVYASL